MALNDALIYTLLALFFPIFPLSMVVSYLLQKYYRIRSLLFVLFPSTGLLLYSISNAPSFPKPFLWLGLLSSLLYALRSLYPGSLSRWSVYHFLSLISLLWLFLLRAEVNILLVASLSLPFLILSILDRFLIDRFGSSHLKFLTGLGWTSPRFSFLIALSLLLSAGMPMGTVFFYFLTSSFLSGFWELMVLSFLWFLWGWSTMRLLSSLLWGDRNGNLLYEDLDAKSFYFVLSLTLITGALGVIFLEVML